MTIKRQEINKKIFSNVYKKNGMIQEIVEYCSSEKIVNKSSFIHSPATADGV